MSRKMPTADFLHLLCCYLKANPDCLIAVPDYNTNAADKPILGYYDNTYYYIIPTVILPAFYAHIYGKYKADVTAILRELFAMDFIKVHWIFSGEVRYRPQERIGKTKKRYITLYRRKIEKYMKEHFAEGVSS